MAIFDFDSVFASFVALAGPESLKTHPITMKLVVVAALVCFFTRLIVESNPSMASTPELILSKLSMFCGAVTLLLLDSVIMFPLLGWFSYTLFLPLVLLPPIELRVKCFANLAKVFLRIVDVIVFQIKYILAFFRPPPPQDAAAGRLPV